MSGKMRQPSIDVDAEIAFSVVSNASSGPEMRLTEQEKQWLFDNSKKLKGTECVLEMKTKFKKSVSAATVSRYKAMTELKSEVIGRPQLLSTQMENSLLTAVRRLRLEAHAVDASLVAAAARGMIERNRRGSTTSSGGCQIVSTAWACKWLKSHGFRFRAPMTDRTVSAEQIMQEGTRFFAELREIGQENQYAKENVYNMDEFFVRFEESGNTWEQVAAGEKKNIAVRQPKQGFTCSVCTAANGDIVLMQFVYKGTPRVYVEGYADNENVLQCCNVESHFQTAATFKEWNDRFMKLANKRKTDPSQQILLIIDQARQHVPQAAEGLRVVKVPPAQTHIFQPADQFIIANVKKKAEEEFKRWIAVLFEQDNVDDAVKAMNAQSVPLQRRRRVEFVVRGAEALGPRSVIKSWNVTGIPNCLWNDAHETVFDKYAGLLENSLEGLVVDMEIEEVEEADKPTQPKSNRGRPKLSDEERVKRAREKIAEEERNAELKKMPLKQRRLAESARGTRDITAMFASARGRTAPQTQVVDDSQVE
jgi:hypothetical protein